MSDKKHYDYESYDETFIKLLSPNIQNHSIRKLYGTFIPHAELNCPNAQGQTSSDVRCVKCDNLDICKSLNGYTLQEVYYPGSVDLSGTCAVVESLASELYKQIFGPSKTFRDNPYCREIVMEYLCRFWGSNNRMYTNCCYFSEASSQGAIVTPRPPCRSFCVQVAGLCSNDPNFVQLCQTIVCPQSKKACTSDPTVSGVQLNAQLNCSVPYLVNPYRSSGRKSFSNPFSSILIQFLFFMLICFLLRM